MPPSDDSDGPVRRTDIVTPAGSQVVDGTSVVGDGEQHVSVTGFIEGAVAGEVASSQLLLDVIDTHLEPTREQVLPVPTDGLGPAKGQRVGIAPSRRSSDHHDVLGQARAPLPRALESHRHTLDGTGRGSEDPVIWRVNATRGLLIGRAVR